MEVEEIRVDFQIKTCGLVSVILLMIRNYMMNFLCMEYFWQEDLKLSLDFQRNLKLFKGYK